MFGAIPAFLLTTNLSHGGKKPRRSAILVVEDDNPTARALARTFEPIWPVRIVGSVKEAQSALAGQERFSGAIIDVGLPDGSGLDVATMARDSNPTLLMLVLTGYTDQELINRAQELGAEYVCKPNHASNIGIFARRLALSEYAVTERARRCIESFALQKALSLRETQIVGLATLDWTRERISGEIGISINTLKREIASILKKCHEESLGELVWRLRSSFRGPE